MEEEVREFFRHCPACGRRFSIRLVGKVKVGEVDTENRSTPPTFSGQGLANASFGPALLPGGQAVLKESVVPVVIRAVDFRFTYRCGHCGHTWQELKTEVN
jgi:hypothetical protein